MASMVLKHIKKKYGDVEVLNDINLEIKDGEFIVLIGESGSGKSTLLRMICGLDDITSGTILTDGVPANDLNPQERDMSMVFQSYALYPHMSVYDNIAYNLRIKKISKEKIDVLVKEVAKLLNIDLYLDRLPKNLSGGQRQRVSMGRAIVRKPKFFLFDEPLSNLDTKLRVVMRKEIKDLQKRLKITTIYVTHDQIEAMTMADKIVLLDSGNIVQMGTPKELFNSPNSIFTALFLGSPSMSLIQGKISIEDNSTYVVTECGTKFIINQKVAVQNTQEVVLGVRPNDFYVSNAKDGYLVDVETTEYTGVDDRVYGKIANNDISVVIPSEIFKDDEDLYISYDVNKTHIFDKKTSKVVR